MLLVWSSRQAYSDISTGSDSSGFFSDWFSASTETYQDSTLLQWLLLAVLAGWIIGAVFWLMELKRQKISYKSAFKDLFLTIRK